MNKILYKNGGLTIITNYTYRMSKRHSLNNIKFNEIKSEIKDVFI